MPAPRPEFENPPEVYYNANEAKRYNVSTRVRHIQRQMTLRALELLNFASASHVTTSDTLLEAGTGKALSRAALLLDIGCGSGISGEVLTEQGHAWIGTDISRDMLNIAKMEELEALAGGDVEVEGEEEDLSGRNTRPNLSHVRWGLVESSSSSSSSSGGDDDEDDDESNPDLLYPTSGDGQAPEAQVPVPAPTMVEVLQNDIGMGIPFRPGSFDGCVSISVLQWLCHSSKKGEVPQRRLRSLFQSLYNALRRGAKAVFQFYPSSAEQVEMISKAAMKCGFSGGVVVDFPHSSKAKKHYLVLQAGQVAGVFVPPPALLGDPLEDEEDEEDELYSRQGDSSVDGEGEDGSDALRTRARVGGRDREAVKRSRSTHQHGGDRKRRRKDNRPVTGTKEWVLLKKEERRRRGEKTTADSKYTMRKRKPRF